MEEAAERIWARATINLPGLPVGSWALVDPDDPYVADALRTEALAAEEEHDG